MKHLILLAGVVASATLPSVAQPTVGGPVQLRNPHRRGNDGTPGNGNAMPGVASNTDLGGALMSTPIPAPTPPAVAMFVDGPYLFVLRGDSLFQFDKKTLKLINSTQLPRLAFPTPIPTPTEENVRTHISPPLRPGPNLRPELRF